MVSKGAPLAFDLGPQLTPYGFGSGKRVVIIGPLHFKRAQLAAGGLACRYVEKIHYRDSALAGKRL